MRDPRDESVPKNGSGFNRRDFLRGSGAAVAATALATSEQGASAQDATTKKSVKSAAPQDVTLNVNGKDHTVKIEPRVTLLDTLRDDLNLTGCKDVCDTTNCGACTVLIDGKPCKGPCTVKVPSGEHTVKFPRKKERKVMVEAGAKVIVKP